MSRSQELFAEAQKYIPGGVNSPVRACVPTGISRQARGRPYRADRP